jgi:pimeloyl-ACP methyl ester carboxylesterase
MVKEDSAQLAARIAAEGLRCVVTFDNRGSGESTVPPDADFCLETMANDCAAVIRHSAQACGGRGGLATAHVFGVSLGGCVAQLLTLRHAELVASLAIGCSHFGGPGHVKTSQKYRALISAEPSRGPSEEHQRRWLQYMRQSLAINYSPTFQNTEPARFDQMLDAFVQVELTRPAGGKEAQMAAITNFIHKGVQRELCRVNTPTLIVHGGEDQVIPVENAALLAAEIPNAELCILQHLGHMFWDEDCNTVVRILSSFCDRQDRLAHPSAAHL